MTAEARGRNTVVYHSAASTPNQSTSTASSSLNQSRARRMTVGEAAPPARVTVEEGMGAVSLKGSLSAGVPGTAKGRVPIAQRMPGGYDGSVSGSVSGSSGVDFGEGFGSDFGDAAPDGNTGLTDPGVGAAATAGST